MAAMPVSLRGIMNAMDHRSKSREALDTIAAFVDGRYVSRVRNLSDLSDDLVELSLEPEPEHGILWVTMRPAGRPAFTLQMIRDFLVLFAGLEVLPAEIVADFGVLIYRSDVPGVFNRGGDLPLFFECINARDEEVLRLYAQGCALMSYRNRNFPMLPLVTAALIQGDAMGGGFEAALSCDLIFAERQAKFGFPEVLFNLFPGMGAVTYLTRRCGMREAEDLIVGGRHYLAPDMYDRGAIDHVLTEGRGVEELRTFLRPKIRRFNAWSGFHRGRRLADPVSRPELSGIADIWVERAMKLDGSVLRRMTELIRKQEAELSRQAQALPPRPRETRMLAEAAA